MSYVDYTKIRRSVTKMTTDSVFSLLIKETVLAIHGLKLFYEVGTRIRAQSSVKFPSCEIRPVHCEEREKHLSGMRVQNDYTINPAFIVKHPSDNIAIQQVLYLGEAVRGLFGSADNGSGPFVFSSIPQHFNTNINPIEIEPLQLIDNEAIVFNSGINIVYSLWETL
jgi:hypothetical protein